MPNIDGGMNAAYAAFRWHMACPLCKKAEGAITVKETETNGTRQSEVICKDCGSLGKMNYLFDFACPSGITEIEHGKAAAILFSMWFVDNPPDAVQQLAAVARRHELQSGDDGDSGAPCPTCGRSGEIGSAAD